MNIYLILALVIGILIYIALKKMSKGELRGNDEFMKYIEWLLNKGYSNGTLMIDHAKSNKFLQLSKYVKANKDYGIELAFPDAEWSKNYYRKLERLCKEENYTYNFNTGSDGMKFLHIDFGKNTKRANECTKSILIKVFELPEKEKYHVLLHNCAIK